MNASRAGLATATCVLVVACSGGELDAPPAGAHGQNQLNDATGGASGSGATPPIGAGGSDSAGAGGSDTGGAAGTSGSGTGGAAGTSGSGGSGTGGVAGSAASCPPSGTGGAGGGSPTMGFCGDGHRDPSTEECDDGNTVDTDGCTSSCTVLDQLAVAPSTSTTLPPPAGRRLGEGRHPVAASSQGAAVAFVDELTFDVGISTFDTVGTRTNTVASFAPGLQASNPVLTRTPCSDGYLLAWTDFNGDGDELGVALAHLDLTGAQVGTTKHANTTKVFSQRDPDLLATAANHIVVAWVDDSDEATSPDVRYTILGNDLSPGAEQTLAATGDAEANVSLAPFGDSWAVAWRAGQGATESIVVRAMGVTTLPEWTLGPLTPGPADDRPALMELDATHLYAFYSEGADTDGSGVPDGSILHGAVLSTIDQSVTVCDPMIDMTTDVSHPAAIRVGSRMYVSWRSAAALGAAEGEEVWIAPVTPSTTAVCPTVGTPVLLPRQDAHHDGDQRHPALAASPLGPQGALFTAWEDLGNTFTGEGNVDVTVELIPTPIVRLGGM